MPVWRKRRLDAGRSKSPDGGAACWWCGGGPWRLRRWGGVAYPRRSGRPAAESRNGAPARGKTTDATTAANAIRTRHGRPVSTASRPVMTKRNAEQTEVAEISAGILRDTEQWPKSAQAFNVAATAVTARARLTPAESHGVADRRQYTTATMARIAVKMVVSCNLASPISTTRWWGWWGWWGSGETRSAGRGPRRSRRRS